MRAWESKAAGAAATARLQIRKKRGIFFRASPPAIGSRVINRARNASIKSGATPNRARTHHRAALASRSMKEQAAISFQVSLLRLLAHPVFFRPRFDFLWRIGCAKKQNGAGRKP